MYIVYSRNAGGVLETKQCLIFIIGMTEESEGVSGGRAVALETHSFCSAFRRVTCGYRPALPVSSFSSRRRQGELWLQQG